MAIGFSNIARARHSTPLTTPALPLAGFGFLRFLLFPKMKFKLKGRHFVTVEIQCESQMVSGVLTKRDFQGALGVVYWCTSDYSEGEGGQN